MRFITSIFLFAFTMNMLMAQQSDESTNRFNYSAVHKIEKRESYSVFYPGNKEEYSGVVVLIHSDQSSNPKAYGNFIKHLLQQNYIVIYPAYQDFVASKKKNDTQFISESISNAYEDIALNYNEIMSLPVALIGHSMGGIIAYELSMRNSEVPKKPSCVISLAPAEVRYHRLKNLNFDQLDSYDVYLVIEEQGDKHFRKKTGKRIMDKLASAQRKKHIIHPGGTLGKSKHLNAWAFDDSFSSKNNTLVSYFARMLGKTNEVDKKMYWPAIDHALDCAFSREGCDYFREN